MSLISVLLPVKNGGAYLQRAVDSILEQTHSQFELIVVDDHSVDGAVEALRPHPKLRCLGNAGVGVSAATQTAADVAQGDYLARMDGDDIALPVRLEAQLEFLQQNPGLGLCGAEVEIFADEGELGGGYQRYQHWINQLHTPEEISQSLFIESPIPNPTVMFRREVFEQLGGFRDPVWHEDYDLYLRAHFSGVKMGKPHGVLLRWRDHDLRSTRNQSRYLEKNLVACKAHYLQQHVLGRRPVIICGTGPVGLALHDALIELGVEVIAFNDVAGQRIGQSKRGKPVLSYDAVGPGQDVIYLGALGQLASRKALQRLFDEREMRLWRDYVMCA